VRRKWLFVLALCVGVGFAPAVWFAAEDARRAGLLGARVREAEARSSAASDRLSRIFHDHKSGDEVEQAIEKLKRAQLELEMVRVEQARRQSWPARLRWEVYRRTGW
jgi:hypothetical protein